jgi:hypothetical protein
MSSLGKLPRHIFLANAIKRQKAQFIGNFCFALSKATFIENLNITSDGNNVMKIYVTRCPITIVVVLVAALSLSTVSTAE